MGRGRIIFKDFAINNSMLIFLLMIATYACYVQLDNWNITSRLALTAELTQRGHVTIDGYEDDTGDRALFNKHFYSDKAPGVSLLAAPIAFIFTRFCKIGHEDVSSRIWNIFTYVCTLSVSGLVTAFAAALLFEFVRRRTGKADAALVGALTFGLATPMFGWSTAFFGHATAGAFLLIGFIALCPPPDAEFPGFRALAGGLALGLAVTVEYTAAISAIIIGAVLAVQLYLQDGSASTTRFFAIAAAGGVLGVAPALIYNTAAFGSPFNLGYSHVTGFKGMQTGLFGIGLPKLGVMRELIVGARRGILWFCPAIIIMAAVWFIAVSTRNLRAAGVAAGLVAVWYLLMNAGYVYWDGGWSTGPRHLTPAFALLSLTFGLGWPLLPNWARAPSLIVVALSVLINLMAASVDMNASDRLSNPLIEYIVPEFVSGAHNSALAYLVLKRGTFLNIIPVLGIWTTWSMVFWYRVEQRHRDTSRIPST